MTIPRLTDLSRLERIALAESTTLLVGWLAVVVLVVLRARGIV